MAAEKMSEVRHSILTRCSTRSFTAEPVPDELLMQLIDAGLAAGIFHQKLLTIRDLKEYLNANGVEMRL